jgi:hypothetical protein
MAVDFSPAIRRVTGANIATVETDIRAYNTDEQWDVILMLSVSIYLTENEAEALYRKCARWLSPNGVLLAKHQCGTEKNVTVSTYSEALRSHYIAYYRTPKVESQLLYTSGLDVEIVATPHPGYSLGHDNTKLRAFVCHKSLISDFPAMDEASMLQTFKSLHNSTRMDIPTCTENLQLAYDGLQAAGIRPLLAYGTLLGAVRDHAFIKYDQDTDLIILPKDRRALRALIARRSLMGMPLVRIHRHIISYAKGGEYIDLYLLRPDNGWYRFYPADTTSQFDLSMEEADNPDTISFVDRQWLVPRNPEAVLARWYGDTWRTPIDYGPRTLA